jgi:multidrug resistance efflux pump
MNRVGAILWTPFAFVGASVRLVLRALRGVLRSFLFWIVIIVAVIVVLVAYYAVADRETPLTTNAYVQAFVVQVAPQVAGQVIRVHVQEGSEVKQGQLLFELDPRPFEHKVALLDAKKVESEHKVKELETQVAAAKAEHARIVAEAEFARIVYGQEEQIFKKESTTERKYQDAVQKHKAAMAAVERSEQQVRQAQDALDARIGNEHALVAQAKAQLAEARLNLSYSKVYAPCDGVITNLQLREGAYAHVGQAVLVCIDTTHWIIIANFREECLERMKPGQPALVGLHGLPGKLLNATVGPVGWGVSQGQGIPSGLLPDVRNRTSWIPESQPFQVRLTLNETSAVPLRIGMTGSVSVYVIEDGRLNKLTRGIHQFISWLYYL